MTETEPTQAELEAINAIKAESEAEEKFIDDIRKGRAKTNINGGELRNRFLCEVFLSTGTPEIRIENATIPETLNLNFCDVKRPIIFHDCKFEKGISLMNATLPQLALPGCKLFGWKEEQDWEYGKQKKEMALLARGATVTGSVYLDHNFIANGIVELVNANIGGQLCCSGGKFYGGEATDRKADSKHISIRARQMKASLVLMNDGFCASGEVELVSSEISGGIDCSGGTFSADLSLSDSKAKSYVFLGGLEDLGRSKNNAKSEFKGVNLVGAEIGESLCCRGKFNGHLDGQRLKVEGDLLMDSPFHKTKFSAGVNLTGALISGDAKFRGSIFLNQVGRKASPRVVVLNAKSLQAENMILNDAIFGGGGENLGEVNLSNVRIRGDIECKGVTWRNAQKKEGMALNARNMIVKGDFDFIPKHETVSGEIHLNGAQVGVEFTNCRNLCEDDHLNSRKYSYSIRGFRYHLIDYEGYGNYIKNGETKSSEKSDKDHDDDFNRSLAWLKSFASKSGEFSPQPYEQLMEVERRMGHANCARRVGFELEERRRERLGLRGYINARQASSREENPTAKKKRTRPDLWGWLRHAAIRSLWTNVLRRTIGYGYKPFRFVGRVVDWVSLGTFLFGYGATFSLLGCDIPYCIFIIFWAIMRFVWFIEMKENFPEYWITKMVIPIIVGLNFIFTPPRFEEVKELEQYIGLGKEWIPASDEILLSEEYMNYRKARDAEDPGKEAEVEGSGLPKGYPKHNPFFYALEAMFPVFSIGQLEAWHPPSPFLNLVRWFLTIWGTVLLGILVIFGISGLSTRWRD